MIQTREMKKVIALEGHVVLQLEESVDGFLDIRVQYGAENIRLGIEESNGIHFKFIKPREEEG